jgi:hypothetical protein
MLCNLESDPSTLQCTHTQQLLPQSHCLGGRPDNRSPAAHTSAGRCQPYTKGKSRPRCLGGRNPCNYSRGCFLVATEGLLYKTSTCRRMTRPLSKNTLLLGIECRRSVLISRRTCRRGMLSKHQLRLQHSLQSICRHHNPGIHPPSSHPHPPDTCPQGISCMPSRHLYLNMIPAGIACSPSLIDCPSTPRRYPMGTIHKQTILKMLYISRAGTLCNLAQLYCLGFQQTCPHRNFGIHPKLLLPHQNIFLVRTPHSRPRHRYHGMSCVCQPYSHCSR